MRKKSEGIQASRVTKKRKPLWWLIDDVVAILGRSIPCGGLLSGSL